MTRFARRYNEKCCQPRRPGKPTPLLQGGPIDGSGLAKNGG